MLIVILTFSSMISCSRLFLTFLLCVLIIRSTFSRYTLAADCIDALRSCLSIAPSSSNEPNNTNPSSLLRTSIRSCSVIPSIISCFVELGQLLEKNVIQQRVEVFGESSESDDSNATNVKSNSLLQDQSFLRLEFEQWERHLWYVIVVFLSFVCVN